MKKFLKKNAESKLPINYDAYLQLPEEQFRREPEQEVANPRELVHH